MTPMMHERVRNMFGDAGLTTGFTVQQLMYDDPDDLSKAIMVFRPNGGSNIRTDLGSEYHVLVDVVGAKDKRKDALSAVRRIVDYVHQSADEGVEGGGQADSHHGHAADIRQRRRVCAD